MRIQLDFPDRGLFALVHYAGVGPGAGGLAWMSAKEVNKPMEVHTHIHIKHIQTHMGTLGWGGRCQDRG